MAQPNVGSFTGSYWWRCSQPALEDQCLSCCAGFGFHSAARSWMRVVFRDACAGPPPFLAVCLSRPLNSVSPRLHTHLLTPSHLEGEGLLEVVLPSLFAIWSAEVTAVICSSPRLSFSLLCSLVGRSNNSDNSNNLFFFLLFPGHLDIIV